MPRRVAHQQPQQQQAEKDEDDMALPEEGSAAAAAAGSSSTAAASGGAAAAPASNPLVDLLNDLKCAICLGVVHSPRSLPCNHFFCAPCLTEQLAADVASEKAAQKAKSNSTLRLPHRCPACRAEYTKRNIVQDPLVTEFARLALALKRQPDVRELRDPDESILEMSQASVAVGTPATPIRRGSSVRRSASDTRKGAHASSEASAATAAAAASPAAAAAPSSRRRAVTPPSFRDPFEFRGTETQTSSGGSHDKAAAAASAAASAALTPSKLVTPVRGARAARKNYRDPGSQDDTPMSSMQDESGDDREAASDDGDDEAELQLAPVPVSAASAPQCSATKALKGYPIAALESGTCAVCCAHSDEEATVTCQYCAVSVHVALCYGNTTHTLTAAERAAWHCDRCSEATGVRQVTCCMCPNTDDQAFKKTNDGRWIHASCAMWSRFMHALCISACTQYRAHVLSAMLLSVCASVFSPRVQVQVSRRSPDRVCERRASQPLHRGLQILPRQGRRHPVHVPQLQILIPWSAHTTTHHCEVPLALRHRRPGRLLNCCWIALLSCSAMRSPARHRVPPAYRWCQSAGQSRRGL